MSDFARGIQFFLGANSASGFSSLYDQWVDQAKMQAFYTIKGGAGCGKSTLMRRVADDMEEAGYSVEYIRCSGDPDSLDGVYFPEKGAALMDGTSPHVMDPAYTGATGHYVDLGAGYDRTALFAMREEIVAATQAYRACYPEAYRCIRGAVESRRRGSTPLHTEETLAKAEKRASGILARELKTTRTQPGKRIPRFLGGPTCLGRVLLEDTVSALCERGYEIRDDCALSGFLLHALEREFLAGGYDVIACLCPEQPNRLEHLLIPEKSLAFVTGPMQKKQDFRTIRTESLVEQSAWQEGRSFLRLSNRVAEELMAEGMSHLARAKACHDVLEGSIIPMLIFHMGKSRRKRFWKRSGLCRIRSAEFPLLPRLSCATMMQSFRLEGGRWHESAVYGGAWNFGLDRGPLSQ